jgi:hypothetical protein
MARGSRELPSTTAAFRANPSRPVRRTAEPAKICSNSGLVSLKAPAAVIPRISGRGRNAASRKGGALRFQGQAIWQRSQPNR